MKNLTSLSLVFILLSITGCQSVAPTLDPVAVQETAVALAWTSVAQTQSVDIVATVNAQGTQIAILSQPTIAITPTENLLMIEDAGLKTAILTMLNLSEAEVTYSVDYNDGRLAMGQYYRIGSAGTNNLPFDGTWFAQKDGAGQWGIININQGRPLCETVQSYNIQFPVLCIDANGNEVTYKW